MRLKIAELIGQMKPLPFTPEQHQTVFNLKQRADLLLNDFDITEYWQINHELNFMVSEVIGNSALRQMWSHLYFQAARMWYRLVRADPAGVAVAGVVVLN
jgi:hypothetical protein